jgi:outer membrane biosynthesis protein TonB
MARLSAFLLASAVAAGAALGLVACGGGGSGDLLPGGTASEINSNLDQVQELVSEGECIGAADAAQEVSAQVGALDGVDQRLKQALREGADRLNEVVAGCEEATDETEPAVETAVEPEEEEKKEKAEKPPKPEKPEKEVEETTEETPPSLPPQAEGKAKGHEEGSEEEVPPTETGGGGTAAGGIGPGTPAESE